MNGEYYSYLMEILLSQGAKDVTYTSVYMKKNRPGTQITVLADQSSLDIIEKTLLLETTTFGIRKFPVERTILDRQIKTIKTALGDVDIKIGRLEGKIVKVTPEYESLKLLAQDLDLALPEVYRKINAWITKELEADRL